MTTGVVERARVEARAASQVATSATAQFLARQARQVSAHRTELGFLAATIVFAIVVAVIGFAVMPSF